MAPVRPLRSASAVLTLAGSLLIPSDGYAAGCDCVRRVGLCQAQAKIEGNRLSFNVFTRECAEVGYSVNDEAGSIAFAGGEESIDYLTPGGIAQSSVSVRSCFVCDARATRPSSARRGGYGAGR